MEWKAVYYNGLETNVEVTKCGKVRKIKVDWYGDHFNCKIGEVNFSKLKLTSEGYRQIGIQIKGLKAKQIQLHQLIASAFLNYKFNGHKKVVMHLDDNPLNNNLNNLKIGTHRENMSQARTTKSGLPVGVCFDKQMKKYRSQIYINGKRIFLGLFKTIEEASNTYQNKLKQI
jgi:hypothetical protein